jgi:hypothetical protein
MAAQPPLLVVPAVFVAQAEATRSPGARNLADAAHADYFVQHFKAAFPTVTDTIDEARIRRTFVVSLQISRASVYDIPKINGNVERQIALTGSLYFTNVRTGEVLFTYTGTTYLDRAVRPEADASTPADDQIYDLAFQSLVDDLVAKASAAFKPYEVAATARQAIGALVVLDRGVRSGLGVGDAVEGPEGAEARAIYAEPNYTVAEVQLGKAQPGAVWSRFSTRGLGDVRKADAVVDIAPDGNRSGLSDEEIRQLFADSLGEKTPFSVVPVNPNFAEVVNYVRERTQLSREATSTRRLPAYFIRLTVSAPHQFEAPTNIAYKTLRTTHVRVYAEVVDRFGRVQFAGDGEDTIKDEVTEGMGYTPAARAEVAVKNALTNLAASMAPLELERVDAPVTALQKDQFSAADPKGILKVSTNLTVLHTFGQLEAGDPVRVPVWSAHVVDVGAGAAQADDDLPMFSGSPRIQAGDIARLERVGGDISGATVQPCSGGEELGSRRAPGLAPMAISLFARSGKTTTYLPGFVAAEAAGLRDSGDFEDKTIAPSSPPQLCVEPVDKIDVVKEACDSNGLCHADISLAVGYRLRRGDEVVKKAALQTTVHSSAYLNSIAPKDRDTLIDDDVEAAAAPLFRALSQQDWPN